MKMNGDAGMSYVPEFFVPGSIIKLPELSGYTEPTDNRYIVIAIHKGGMGECIHIQSVATKCHYALKCIRTDLLCDDNTFDQFINELSIWITASACDAVVEAIGIIRINELPVVFQPWMSGGDLARSFYKLNAEQKIQVILRVVRGLNWVHKFQGVIHCDLKPSNILLDASGVAYIADWGLARPLSARICKAFKLSSDERIVRAQQKFANNFTGTILYSSPEQILNPNTIDHRSDIYSLGCMMYELEAGTPPFNGSSFWEIAHKQITEQPPKLGKHFRKTETGIEKVIETCLEKSPQNRFASYHELEEALIRVAKKKNFSVARSEVAERYRRYVFGTGFDYQKVIHEKVELVGRDYALLSFKQAEPFISEAINLLSVEKYQDAAKLLQPYFISASIEESRKWDYFHSLTESFAYALLHIPDKRHDAIIIYQKLLRMNDKPAEFYVNCSYAYLLDNRPKDAVALCNEGIIMYPEDVSIIGNLTLAYLSLCDYENAAKSAYKRLNIRRDLHAISEIAKVDILRIKELRYTDLPKAVEIIKKQFTLIAEGLKMNPRYAPLLFTELEMYCFVNNIDRAMKKFTILYEDNNLSINIKLKAFLILEPVHTIA